MSVTLHDQIKCVARELALRRNVYRGFVARGKMTQQKADEEIAAMTAVLETLQKPNPLDREPDGYAVVLDDPNGSPGGCGYWYVGIYRTEVVAKGVAERGKGERVVPLYAAGALAPAPVPQLGIKDPRPCIHPIGATTCGYAQDACIHEGSADPAPPAGRHIYTPPSE